MKRSFFVSLSLAIVILVGSVSQSSALKLCDNFGKTWDLQTTGNTLEGIRDTTDLLGCGGTYVRGAYYGSPTKFVLTSLEGNGNCVAVIWDGVWQFNAGSGTWYNNNGVGTGGFTFTAGACQAAVADNVNDPAVK